MIKEENIPNKWKWYSVLFHGFSYFLSFLASMESVALSSKFLLIKT